MVNAGSAEGSGGGFAMQAAPPTAATVPPERTVPRPTAARKTTTKKVVRKTATTVKKAKSTKTVASTKAAQSGTTLAGGSTTTVAKALRATVSGSGTYVAVRAEADPKSALLRRIPDETVISVKCQVVGVAVSDPDIGRKTPLWNQLTTGGYVTNLYTSLYVEGETKPAAGRSCAGSSTASEATEESGTTATTAPAVDNSGKVPAKPVITAVS